MVYRCEYARGKRVTLGKVSVLTPMQARDKAKEILADFVRGYEPGSRRKKNFTLKEFIEKEYAPWCRTNRKRADEDIYRLRARFEEDFGRELLSNITPLLVDKWRSKRIRNGIKPITVNRDIAILKSMLTKAEEWGIISINPLDRFKPARVDTVAKVRYLTKDEEVRLKKELNNRDEKIKASRSKGNEWRNERGYDLFVDLYQFVYADHLTPMVLLSLNTGLRRGELFSLCWCDINFNQAILTVGGGNAKSGKTRHVPLNTVALQILQDWHKQTTTKGLVFQNHNGMQFDNVKKSWMRILERAEIENFRWHDMRHHFASKLVMAGVDLNTVRELLGHADIKMTLRYAHLAPEHKAKAVAKLVEVA